jgi:hypothetical protein
MRVEHREPHAEDPCLCLVPKDAGLVLTADRNWTTVLGIGRKVPVGRLVAPWNYLKTSTSEGT